LLFLAKIGDFATIKEILTHRAESIDQNPLFQTDRTMEYIGRYIYPITIFDNLLFITDGKFKFTLGTISRLCLEMLVGTSFSPFFKLHFNHHDLVIPTHDLP